MTQQLNEELARLEKKRENTLKLPAKALPSFYLIDLEIEIDKLRAKILDSELKEGEV